MTKSVAILGCGPAGLLVAHAAELSGWDFRIYSKKLKSKLYGAQYLHQPIPNLDCGIPKLVKYILRGTAVEYRDKVYGAEWDGTVSPEDFPENHDAWDMRLAYENLWATYQDAIYHHDIKPGWHSHKTHDLVISTVPRKIWAEEDDVFAAQRIWALGDTEHPRVSMFRPADFTVICSGLKQHDWYRVSNIYGACTMEWPYYAGVPQFGVPPARGASLVEKPLWHNSTAASDFIHLGRFGAWRKGYLSHEAFYEAMKVFARDSIR